MQIRHFAACLDLATTQICVSVHFYLELFFSVNEFPCLSNFVIYYPDPFLTSYCLSASVLYIGSSAHSEPGPTNECWPNFQIVFRGYVRSVSLVSQPLLDFIYKDYTRNQ